MNITPDRNCPSYAPLPWWKQELSRWLGIAWKREIVCYKMGDTLFCSPENWAKFQGTMTVPYIEGPYP
jgi:hypothetical protein